MKPVDPTPVPPVPNEVVGHATFLRRVPRFGRVTLEILCCCGYINEFYEWSLAGHGKGRCKGCKNWIAASCNMEVFKPEMKSKKEKKNDLPSIDSAATISPLD